MNRTLRHALLLAFAVSVSASPALAQKKADKAESATFATVNGKAIPKVRADALIAGQVAQTQIKDKSMVFNTARIEALELDNLIEVAKATIVSANARTESRGAHVRDDATDTPETPDGRDDKNWLKHTLWYRDGNRLDYKPVQMKPMSVDTIELKKRAY